MEIGSIFEIDPKNIFVQGSTTIPKLPIEQKNNYIPYYFNTGRSAIEFLLSRLRHEGYKKVYLPSFLCDSVRDAAIRAGMKIEYYKINTDLSIDLSTIELTKNCIFYVVQFFGNRLSDKAIKYINALKSSSNIVIEDITLCLLADDYVGFGDYIVGSLRKWLPITDGGILLTKTEIPDFLPESACNDYTTYYLTAQILKYEYLKKTVRDNSYKKIFMGYSKVAMASLFSDYTIRKMSIISMDLLKGFDFINIREKRIKNYDSLRDLLRDVPQVKVLVERVGNMSPLGMVILVEKRNELLEFLISKGIYCNIHWKSNLSTKHYDDSEFLASHCITIPCDQRYGEKEMIYIRKCIGEFMSK